MNSINAVGVDIAAFSAMKNEEEVLLLPGSPLGNHPGENPEPDMWTFEIETPRPSAATIEPPAVAVESSATANVVPPTVTVEASAVTVGPSAPNVGPSADPVDSPSVMIDYVHPGTSIMFIIMINKQITYVVNMFIGSIQISNIKYL